MKKLSESIWSDMQDRSAGDVVRKEDDINLLDFDEFIEYLKKSYDVCIYDPHNFFEIGRFHIDDEHKRVISIPIEKNDNSETPNMGNRMLTITVNLEHGGEISITPICMFLDYIQEKFKRHLEINILLIHQHVHLHQKIK